jgi:hypothetical protein
LILTKQFPDGGFPKGSLSGSVEGSQAIGGRQLSAVNFEFKFKNAIKPTIYQPYSTPIEMLAANFESRN